MRSRSASNEEDDSLNNRKTGFRCLLFVGQRKIVKRASCSQFGASDFSSIEFRSCRELPVGLQGQRLRCRLWLCRLSLDGNERRGSPRLATLRILGSNLGSNACHGNE